MINEGGGEKTKGGRGGGKWEEEGRGQRGRRKGGEEKEIDERTVDDALALLDCAPADADEAVDAASDLARDLVRAEAREVLACLCIIIYASPLACVNGAWI